MNGTRLTAPLVSLGGLALIVRWSPVLWYAFTSPPVGENALWPVFAVTTGAVMALGPGIAIAVAVSPRSANRRLWTLFGLGLVFATEPLWNLDTTATNWVPAVIQMLVSVGYLITWLMLMTGYIRNIRSSAQAGRA